LEDGDSFYYVVNDQTEVNLLREMSVDIKLKI